MIQDIIFRVIPSHSFFVIVPFLLYILLVYPCLPDAVPHLSTVVGPNYHPPVLSIALLPHATLFSTELHCLQLFLVPLPATRLSHYVCIPSCPSVVSFQLQGYHIMSASLPVRLSSLSVRLSASILLHVCYQGWLPVYSMYIFIKVTLILKSVKCVIYSLIALLIGSLVQTSRLTQTT